MKRFFVIALFVLGFGQLYAQPVRDTAWTKAGYFGLKLPQVSLSSWSAGGESALAFDSQITYSADFKRDRQLWQNRLELGYGLTKNDGKSARKTNDKIYFASTYGYQIYKTLYWSALLNFNTQFAKGYDYNIEDSDFISKFMAPGYLMIGTGVTWSPNKIFTATFTPASWRGTIVADSRLSDEGAFGVDKGKHLLSFVDNHDVSRIASNLTNEKHLPLIYAMMFGMPGIPCVYYGSEWGAKANKSEGDPALRASFDAPVYNDLSAFITKLAEAKKNSEALNYGSFRSVVLTNRQCIFARETESERVFVAINADENSYTAHFDAGCGQAVDLITGDIHDFGGGSELAPYSAAFWKMER